MKANRNWSAYPRPRGGRRTGFTLIELLVAMGVVAILAAIAYPTYVGQVRRGNRAEAKGALLENAQFLERNYTMANCYHRTDSCANTAVTVTLPRTQTPTSGSAKYTIEVAFSNAGLCAGGQCYTLSAVPTGTMAGDSCGTLTLNQTGEQGAGGSNVADCWQR